MLNYQALYQLEDLFGILEFVALLKLGDGRYFLDDMLSVLL